jgi:hypothetical protein
MATRKEYAEKQAHLNKNQLMRERKSKYGMVDTSDMKRMVLNNDYSREMTPGKLGKIK